MNRNLNTAAAMLFALCVARLWLVPLPSSFWVDELVTEFVVQHPGHPSFAAAPQVPESIYYWLPRASQALFGASEISIRLPSILAMLVALFLIGRLAARLIHPQAAWFAVFACLCLRGIDTAAIDARPYGLGMAMAAASLYFLVRWCDAGRWPDAVAFAVAAGVVWRVHLIYWPFYLVFAIYAGARLWRGESRATGAQAGVVMLLVVASLVPVALSVLAILPGAHGHVIAALPTLHVFEHMLRWNLPLICIAGAFLAAWLLLGRLPAPGDSSPARATALILFLSWWLCQPVALFLYSWATGNSVFIPRYLSIMLPGTALAATGAAAMFLPPARWKPAALLLGTGALIAMGRWTEFLPRHDESDWRAAALAERSLAADNATPVVCTSPFIEARSPVWRPDYALPGFLYSHLEFYPTRGMRYLFPYETSPEAEKYAAQLLPRTLELPGRFLLYGPAASVRWWRKWFVARPELVGWNSRVETFGDVYIAVFKRGTAR